MNYGQNSEDQIVSEYFKGFKGTLCDVGANNGITMSNTYKLLASGWKGLLVEPNYECHIKLLELWRKRNDIQIIQAAIGVINGDSILYKNGELYGGTGLVSTLDPNGMKKWEEVTTFEPQLCKVYDYKTLLEQSVYKTFDFISLDAEGFDTVILKQIDLLKVKCVCIEWNSIVSVKEEILQYCKGFRLIHSNAENLILAR
jgi:FkbM family methyltransferase